MADWNTRGNGHRASRKDYDCLYNKGYSWTSLFSILAAKMLAGVEDVCISNHVLNYLNRGISPNRQYSLYELSHCDFSRATCVEIEAATSFIGGNRVLLLKKLVIRLPSRATGEQVCMVLDFHYDVVNPYLKTAYLNHGYDSHQRGLDVSEMESNTDFVFGYERPDGVVEAYRMVKNGKKKTPKMVFMERLVREDVSGA